MNAHRLPGADRTSPAREILEHTATILLDIGLSRQSLLDELRDILRQKGDPTRPFDPTGTQNVAGYTHVLAHWYADPDYRDRRSPRRPAALPLNGPRRSVATLIRRVFPKNQVQKTATALIALGAIRRQGRRYVPRAPHVSFSSDPGVAHLHAYMALLGQMRTIAHNLACEDETQLLFERAATNSRVPVSALPTIHRHIRRVLADTLGRLDAYFSRWETDAGSGPTTLVGAAAFAFDDSTIPGRAAHPRANRRTQARRRGLHHRRAERTP
jgi:hypothetical protein